MDNRLLCFFLGKASLAEGAVLLLPVIYDLLHEGTCWMVFAALALLCSGLGRVLSHYSKEHRNRADVLVSVWLIVLIWPFLGFLGALPFCLTGWLPPLDAFLESFSNVTAVGLSLLPSEAPGGLRFWQSCQMWLGSLCFIFLLATLLPLVSGCFGIELSIQQGRSFSPMVGRMSQLSRKTALVYTALTLFSTLLFRLAGLMPWEALHMAMRCISTGGGDYFPGRGVIYVEQAAMISMLLAGVNLLLYLRAAVQRNLSCLWRDSEVRVFIQLVVAAGIAVAFHLFHTGLYDAGMSLHYGFFHMLSFLSTAGLRAAPLEYWPDFDLFFLLLLVFIGGCMGSVTGDMKIIRILILFKVSAVEVRRTLHPRMMTSIRISGTSVPQKIMGRVLSFFFLYLLVFFLFAVLLSLWGEQLSTAVSMSFACMTGIGYVPGFCEPAMLHRLPAAVKLLCCLIMAAGRVEIFAFLLLVQALWDRKRRNW